MTTAFSISNAQGKRVEGEAPRSEYRKAAKEMADLLSTTEYTPTTGEVQDSFVLSHTRNYGSYMTGVPASDVRREYYEAFNRWRAVDHREVAEKAWDEGYQKGLSTQYGTATPTGKPYDPDRIAELEAKIAAALSCLDSFSWHEHDEGFVKWTRERLTATGQEGSNGDHV